MCNASRKGCSLNGSGDTVIGSEEYEVTASVDPSEFYINRSAGNGTDHSTE